MANQYDFARSPSQRAVYRSCPQKWLLQYGAGWRQKEEKAARPFGKLMEQVATGIVLGTLRTPQEAYDFFLKEWKGYENKPLTYSKKPAMSWKVFHDRARVLIPIIFKEFPMVFDIGNKSYKVQHRLSYRIHSAMEMGFLDLVGPARPCDGEGNPLVSGRPRHFAFGIVDFKVGIREEPAHSAERNEQLMSYQLGWQTQFGHAVDYVGLCRMLYQTEPRVQWLWVPGHSAEMLGDFAAGAVHVDAQIKAGQFAANNNACFDWGGCPMQPLCFKSQEKRRDAELERDPKKIGAGADDFELDF